MNIRCYKVGRIKHRGPVGGALSWGTGLCIMEVFLEVIWSPRAKRNYLSEEAGQTRGERHAQGKPSGKARLLPGLEPHVWAEQQGQRLQGQRAGGMGWTVKEMGRGVEQGHCSGETGGGRPGAGCLCVRGGMLSREVGWEGGRW